MGEEIGPTSLHRPSVLRFTDVMWEARCFAPKINIDGFDYAALRSEYDFLLRKTPIIWIEAQTNDYTEEQDWRQLLNQLSSTWTRIVAFDNFGFEYLMGDTHDSIEPILHFLSYCRRQRQHADLINNNVRVNYSDIVLFPNRFLKVADDFRLALPEFKQM